MIEPRGRRLAEVACRTQLGEHVAARAWTAVSEVLEQYGNYLLLTGSDTPVGEVRVYAR